METIDSLPNAHAENVLAIMVPVTVTVATKTIRLEDALHLVPGEVLRFDQRCDQPLKLSAAGQSIASGCAVTIGERLGVRLNQMQS